MDYQVPQFIEVEDKIVGPLTLKQFIYVAGGAGLCVTFFVYLPKIVAFLLALPVGGLALALAFYKINGKPFISFLEAGFTFYTRSKLFLWKHEDAKTAQPQSGAAVPHETPAVKGARLTRGKLADLAWSLDAKQNPDR